MGIARRLIGERRSFGALAAKIPGPLDGNRSLSGQRVDADSALAHIDVFTAISLISDAIAMIPFRAHRQVAVNLDGRVRMHSQKLARQPQVLVDPMPGDIAPEFSFKHRVMESLLTAGHTYNEIGAVDTQGVPSVVMPIDPAKVREIRMTDGVKEYVMHDGGILGDVRDGGTMFAYPGFIRAGSLKGVSPIKAGMQGIALSMAAEAMGSRYFGDGCHPQGYLYSAKDMAEAKAKDTKSKWARTYQGLNREPAFLYGGLEWRQISISPEESQFIETRAFQSGQIQKLFRIAPHLAGDTSKSTSWGTGIEEQGIGFVSFTLGPWITRLEQALSFLLPRGQFVKGNVSALLRGRTTDRMAAYAVARQGGWMSVNDIRDLEDLPPIEGGDIYLQPLNMVDAAGNMTTFGGDNDRGQTLPGLPAGALGLLVGDTGQDQEGDDEDDS